ncbi:MULTISPECIES: hypothetical protein [Aeromonas]|uniref:hypothetical protein n=1 Tax=Aeromonas TaxID=642 RepID=UPI003F2D6527
MFTPEEAIIILVGCTIAPIKQPIQFRDHQAAITAVIEPQLTRPSASKNSQSKLMSLLGIAG